MENRDAKENRTEEKSTEPADAESNAALIAEPRTLWAEVIQIGKGKKVFHISSQCTQEADEANESNKARVRVDPLHSCIAATSSRKKRK